MSNFLRDTLNPKRYSIIFFFSVTSDTYIKILYDVKIIPDKQNERLIDENGIILICK